MEILYEILLLFDIFWFILALLLIKYINHLHNKINILQNSEIV